MEEILHQLIWSISHSLQSFIYARWCRISSINSIISTNINLQFGSLHVSPILPKWHVSVRRSSPKKNTYSTIGLKSVFNYMYPTVRSFRVLYGKFSNNPHNTVLPKTAVLTSIPIAFQRRMVWQKKNLPFESPDQRKTGATWKIQLLAPWN